MTLTAPSSATWDFAKRLEEMALGNADQQRICFGQPNRNIEFGILFSQTDAAQSRRGDRTDIRPNALSLRFELQGPAPVRLALTPSFWLYFRRTGQQNPPPMDAGDLARPEVIWSAWNSRPAPVGLSAPVQLVTGLSPYVRSRYSQRLDVEVNGSPKTIQLGTDLRNFRNSRQALGTSTDWDGEITIRTQELASGNLEIQISLINTQTYSGPRTPVGEPAWFDVRLRVQVDRPVRASFCPLLDTSVAAQTVNCVLVDSEDSCVLEVEQINVARRYRQAMVPAVTFEEASWSRVLSVVGQFASEAGPQHGDMLRAALRTIESDQLAIRAMEAVLETFRRAMRVRAPSLSWYRHQLAILVLGAAGYLTGARSLDPLVLNIPTAGGKTEAFTAVALWSVAYEVLGPSARWATAIIKYPTKLLSSDQASRLAHYVMHFDAVMEEGAGRPEPPRGLGLFFGADSDDVDCLDVIGPQCPECGQAWSAQTTPQDQPTVVRCPNGHTVVVAIKDQIFPVPPVLIVGTIDKFISKNLKAEMAQVLGGGPFYWCPIRQRYVVRDCWDQSANRWATHNHVPVERRSRLTAVVLDEAHLLREEVGTLDAQFETHYFESARQLSGRYPLPVISTATIAQAEEHCRQLGFGQANIFPSRRRENDTVYYREDSSQIQHTVVSLMPRGRAIAWALPHLLQQYLAVRDASPAECVHLRPALIYCGAYTTRDQTLAAIRSQVDPKRTQKTEIGEFSRRYFDRTGIRQVLSQLDRYDVIVSTNIAAVGIDLGELNVLFYFGMPKNVNEFIQSMNRTGRRNPALVCIVHNPYLERDAAFYAYMRAFLAQPDALVEVVPLNRYARRAIEYTFSSIALGQIQTVWGQRMPRGTDLRRARRYGRFQGVGFREALGTQLPENQILDLLQTTFRSDGDPSAAYMGLVENEWRGLANSIINYTPQGRGAPDFPYGDNWTSCADGVRKPMYQLRLPEPLGRLEYTADASRLAEANVRAIYASDRDEGANPRDDERDILDGALSDTPPQSEDRNV